MAALDPDPECRRAGTVELQWNPLTCTSRRGKSFWSWRARLGPDEVATPVPALPGWTVKDTFAHLTGVCADVLDGNMTDAGSPAWSARQLRERERASLAQVCAEWSSRAPGDRRLASSSPVGGSFLCFDAWSHEQDIRSAIGMAGRREERQVPYLAASAAVVFDRRFREAGATPVRLVTETVDQVVGAHDSSVTLRTSDYELLRMLFGRRSLGQMLAADWDGDPEPCIDHLHLFDPPVNALID